MTKIRVIFGVWLLVWILVLFVGIELYAGVVGQKVPGYPTSGQLGFYVFFPSLLVVANVFFIARARKLSPWAVLLAFFIELLAVPTFFFIGSGGI